MVWRIVTICLVLCLSLGYQGTEAKLYQHKDKWKQQTEQQHHEGSSSIPSKAGNQISVH